MPHCSSSIQFISTYSYNTYNGSRLQENTELEVDAYLRRRYEGQIANIEIVSKEDLDLVSVVCLVTLLVTVLHE